MILLLYGIEDFDLMIDVLLVKVGCKVVLGVFQCGEKVELVDNVLCNVCESLVCCMLESVVQIWLLEGLVEVFDLFGLLQCIEVYDNSYIQGVVVVGGMVVVGFEGWIKSQYCKFNIKGIEIMLGDDFGMMKEVLICRFQCLLKEDFDCQIDIWFDLLLIDGGVGQVSVVYEIMVELGVEDILMIGVVKGQDCDYGKEEFYCFGSCFFVLCMNDLVLYFIQCLCDEVYCWVIGMYCVWCIKQIMVNFLDEIIGIGVVCKCVLLVYFGSVKVVLCVGLVDLIVVDGISEFIVQKIVDYFYKS